MCTECYGDLIIELFSGLFRKSRYHRIQSTDIMDKQTTLSARELTKCGLCNDTLSCPKTLSCLHAFCLSCLKQLTDYTDLAADGTTEEGLLLCPICKSATQISSSDALEDLPDNVFISSVVERSQKAVPGKETVCICCEERSSTLLARCVNCDGFLCKKGIQLHQRIKLLRHHKICNLVDLQSGKVESTAVFIDEKQLMCQKHKTQVFWFFCETCNVLICRDCTVVSHCSPDHTYVELDVAAIKQKQSIQRLLEESTSTATRIDDALRITKSTQSNIVKNAEQAELDLGETAESIISHVHKAFSAEKKRIQEHVDAAQNKLGNTERDLLRQQAQLKRAQFVATHLLSEGSDFDVTSVYQQLKTCFQKSSSVETALEQGLCRVAFNPDADIVSNLLRLGTLTLGVTKVSQGRWIVDRKLSHEGHGMVRSPSGIAVTSDGQLVVANCDQETPVHIYNPDGTLRVVLDKRSKKATNVTVASSSDEIFATTDRKKYVTVFKTNGKYLRKFPTFPPGQYVTEPDTVLLRGIAFRRSSEQVVVGEESRKYISVHGTDGSHIKSFYVLVNPYFLAITNDDYIVVSPREEKTGVHIIDFDGNHLRTLNPIRDPQMKSWYPSGVCVSVNNEICIANFGEESKGVHCFACSGEYLGCVCKGIDSPEGLALTSDDTKFIIAEWGDNNDSGAVKVFQLQQG